MAGEVGPRRRIRFANLAPADVLFFANGGPRAKPAAVDHMGINIGNGWMIHSSRYGVALVPLDGCVSTSPGAAATLPKPASPSKPRISGK